MHRHLQKKHRERTKSIITARRMKCLIVIMQSRQFIESMLWHELSRQVRMREEPRNRGAKETEEKKKNVGSLLTFHFTIGSEIIEAKK